MCSSIAIIFVNESFRLVGIFKFLYARVSSGSVACVPYDVSWNLEVGSICRRLSRSSRTKLVYPKNGLYSYFLYVYMDKSMVFYAARFSEFL